MTVKGTSCFIKNSALNLEHHTAAALREAFNKINIYKEANLRGSKKEHLSMIGLLSGKNRDRLPHDIYKK